MEMHESSKEILDIQVMELLEPTNNKIVDKGKRNMVESLGYSLLPFGLPLHEFYLDELQYFSKCLIDLSLKSRTNLKTRDFSAYWGWTAALAEYLEWMGKFNEYEGILRDYFFLVHSVLLSERHSQISRRNPSLRGNISRINPSIEGVSSSSSLIAAATYGFSVLEGVLKRRCHELENSDHIKIWEGIKELLQDRDVSTMTKEILTEIDDLERYDRAVLEGKMEGIPDLSDRSRLSWLITKQRNYNIHGEGSTLAIGSVVLTLCSLVLLDAISELSMPFKEIRDGTIGLIQAERNRSSIHPLSSAAFYPVETL